MKKSLWLLSAVLLAAAGIFAATTAGTDEQEDQAAALADVVTVQPSDVELAVEHPECSYFSEIERFSPPLIAARRRRAADLNGAFAAMSIGRAVAVRPAAFGNAQTDSGKVIDQNVIADLQANGITPAGKTTDWEFARRASLDLTGRIPAGDSVTQFVNSTDPNKRAAYIDQLLASSAWVDKWTMFYGDLFRNTAANAQIQIRPEGRNAFYKWIHDSLASGKPYNSMAGELIGAQGNNSFDQSNGQINYLTLGVVNGGPVQDIFDQQTANIADQFLGIAHMNCLLCHSGRGHLETLSLWGSQGTRSQAWGQSAFMARTQVQSLALPTDPAVAPPPAPQPPVIRYWALGKLTSDYSLNTTTGNRPARQPVGTIRVVTPTYMFGGQTPLGGQDYRAALAKFVTSDFQFSRAAVNYIWAAMFGMGIVDPPDQFDPARLDPSNPPVAPWTLQPSNPALLNALAQWFIDNKYDVRGLIRLIANSDTYQLASEYNGTWNPSWNQHFGRKLVRRLWSEEVHDSVVTAINTLPSYNVPGFSVDSTVYGANSPGFGRISYAMQAPDVVNMPDGGGAVSQFLDLFLRGNRDDQVRKADGSILQALGLMNNAFIENRVQATGTGTAATYLQKYIQLSDDLLINKLFLDVLSRYPNTDEYQLAAAQLRTGGASVRTANAVDLLWTLLNKVDFVFNY